MRIISRKQLRNCWIQRPKSEASLKEWYNITSRARWQKPNDVTDTFKRSRYIGDDRFIFNIKQDAFRLVVHINFMTQIVYIRFVGTHAEYDKIDAKTV